MFCTSCGTKVPDGAKFCTVCGSPIEASTDSSDAVRKDIREQAPAAPTMQTSAHEGAKRSSFAAFMMQRRQIGRVAMPTFVAILAAIILTAGVAYALVKAYEAFVLPQTQQQEQPATVEKKSSKKQVAATNKKAHKAYEGVVARYEDFASYCEQAGAGAANYDDWAQGRGDDSGLGQIFVYLSQVTPGTLDYYYAYSDLNGDGIDELLIGYADKQREAALIVEAYCFVDGAAVSVAPASEVVEDSSNMTNQYNGFITQGEGQSITICKDGIVKFSCAQDGGCRDADFYYSLTDEGPVLKDAAQCLNQENDRQNGTYLVRTIEDGGDPQESTVQGSHEAHKVLDRFSEKHPEADFEKPSANSDMWKAFKAVEPSKSSSASATDDADNQDDASQASSQTASGEGDAGEVTADDDDTIADMDSFIANAKNGLFVPDDPSITCEVSDTPSYWEGTASYVWYVAFYKDDKVVASADCSSNGFPSSAIMAYHES